MRKIKDIISKPSEALQAMVDGLREQSKRPDFVIDMGTFGHSFESGICYGCAATCTIQKITNATLKTQNIYVLVKRAGALNLDDEDLSDFESAIDDAREGMLEGLFEYFDLENELEKNDFKCRFHLKSNNWEEELPKVEILIAQLKDKNL